MHKIYQDSSKISAGIGLIVIRALDSFAIQIREETIMKHPVTLWFQRNLPFHFIKEISMGTFYT